MATATDKAPAQWTVADLAEVVGPVPLSRIRFEPPPGTATGQDVADIHARENRLFELVDGVLVEKVVGFRRSCLAAVLIQVLRNFLADKKLGTVSGPDGMVRLGVRLVRIPDVSFVSWDRLPGRKLPSEPIPDLVPNLAVEVLSAGNTEEEMKRKLREYFAAGVEEV